MAKAREESNNQKIDPAPTTRITRSQSRRAENAISGQLLVNHQAPGLGAQSQGSSDPPLRTNKPYPKQNPTRGLLQAYRNDQGSAPKPAPKPDPIVLKYSDLIVKRLVGTARANQTDRKVLSTIVGKLAKYDQLFERFLEYAEGSAKRNFSLMSFSKVHRNDTLSMGIQIQPAAAYDSLTKAINDSGIPRIFHFTEYSSIRFSAYRIFNESDGTKAFQSPSETVARTRISGLVAELIDKDATPRTILIAEHLSLGNLRSKTPPVEIQHIKSDGSIHSTFLSGTLDYICCASHDVDEPDPQRERAPNLAPWERSSEKVSLKGWDLYRFTRHLEEVVDKTLALADCGPVRWESLVIEAKCMTERFTFSAGLTLSAFDLFLLDPDKWLSTHDTLKTLLPSCRLNGIIIDRYLFMIWTSSQRGPRCARYMPIDFLSCGRPGQDEITTFRAISRLPPSGHCSFEPVVGVIIQDEVYYVVVVLPALKTIHLIGQEIGMPRQDRHSTRWALWEQQLLNISLYHGWDMRDYVTYHTDWPRDGSGNNGLAACQAVEFILDNGFDSNSDGNWDIPRFPCAHKSVLKIAQTIHSSCQTKVAQFSTLYKDRPSIFKHHYRSRLEGIEGRIQKLSDDVGFTDALSQLKAATETCKACISSSEDDSSSDESIYYSCMIEADDESGNEDEPDGDFLPRELTHYKEAMQDPSISDPAIDSSSLTRGNDTSGEVASDGEDDSLGPCGVQGDLANRLGDLIIDLDGPSGSVLHEGKEEESTQLPSPGSGDPQQRAEVPPQKARPRQKSLIQHVYQAVAECLAIYTAIEFMRQNGPIMKFCISSSNEWLFGLIDCSDNVRPCYLTTTLTIENAQHLIFLLSTWINAPPDRILECLKTVLDKDT